MFQNNAKKTGVYQTTGLRHLTGVKWKFRQSTDVASVIPGLLWSLSVDNGVVCTVGSGGNIYGLDINTGQQLWRYQLGHENLIFPLTVANQTVYIGYRQLNTTNRNEHIHAIDIQSGQLKWQFTIEFQPSMPTFTSMLSFSAPAINNEVLYIGASNGELYALNSHSGELIWNFKTTKNMSLAAPAIGQDTVCICCSDGYLYAVDTIAKEQKWKFEIGPFPIKVSPYPAITDRRVYIVTSDNTLYALELDTGEILWTFNVRNLLLSSPAVTKEIICINGGENYLYALDSETGQLRWSFKAGNIDQSSNPIIADREIYFGSQRFLKAVDLETGQQLWQFEIPFSDKWMLDPQTWLYGLMNQSLKIFTGDTQSFEKFSDPVVANGTVYVSCSNGYVYAIY